MERGEKTLTFTVEDALLSPIGFSVLSGAGLFRDAYGKDKVHVHTTASAYSGEDGSIDLSDALGANETIDMTAPVFIMLTEADGSLSKMLSDYQVYQGESETEKKGKKLVPKETASPEAKNKSVFVDFYVTKDAANIAELQIDMANFGGYYYVEASTLFRRQSDGVDMPAEITFPNVKIQSNFTFSMASTGDPSTFTFTMDAFPGYTIFDPSRKVLCVIQVVEDADGATDLGHSVMWHEDTEVLAEAAVTSDSTNNTGKTDE